MQQMAVNFPTLIYLARWENMYYLYNHLEIADSS